MAAPTNPESVQCAFGIHIYAWAEPVPGNKHAANLHTSEKVSVPAMFQVGTCIRCGIAIKREM